MPVVAYAYTGARSATPKYGETTDFALESKFALIF